MAQETTPLLQSYSGTEAPACTAIAMDSDLYSMNVR